MVWKNPISAVADLATMSFFDQLYVNGYHMAVVIILPVKYAETMVPIIAAASSALLGKHTLWMECEGPPPSSSIVELVLTRALRGAAA